MAIITSVCLLANYILNKTVRMPLKELGKRLDQFNTESQKTRLQQANNMNILENRVIKVEGRLDGHDIELKHLYERDVEKNEKD
ncbi:hypothetical protein ACLOCO_08560 [Lactiplantibacillus plantarum]|uniref:hypothetical protein n=1 Tax=Lactiplantibacillus plantarum TaxID=1590 RepID=UPI003EBD25CF